MKQIHRIISVKEATCISALLIKRLRLLISCISTDRLELTCSYPHGSSTSSSTIVFAIFTIHLQSSVELEDCSHCDFGSSSSLPSKQSIVAHPSLTPVICGAVEGPIGLSSNCGMCSLIEIKKSRINRMVTPLQFTFLEYTVPGVIVHILHLVGYFCIFGRSQLTLN